MNRSLPIPNVPFLRNRQPSLQEVEGLLDYLPQACLLLDLEKNQIVLANARATELTAFTRSELIASGKLEPTRVCETSPVASHQGVSETGRCERRKRSRRA